MEQAILDAEAAMEACQKAADDPAIAADAVALPDPLADLEQAGLLRSVGRLDAQAKPCRGVDEQKWKQQAAESAI